MTLDLTHLIWFTLLALGLMYWWTAYGIKQLALQATLKYCRKMDVQLLDQSLALKRISVTRSTNGRLQFIRMFDFEFASTGNDRYVGETTMHGRICTNIELSPHRI